MEPGRVEILFADDDAAMREMVGDVLRSHGYRVRVVSGGDEALREVRASTPTIVVLDYRMGKPDGLEVCAAIKGDPRHQHLPVLILTGQSGIEDRIQGFDAGADDYLAKPFDARELLARVRALILLTERSLHRNPTSGLPGGDAIQREFERRRVGETGFAACYFDLDHFKPFGDTFGFAAADRAIQMAGESLRRAAGPDDFVGHIGGDDFVLFCSRETARERCQEARRDFGEAVLGLVPEAVRERGSYRALDREGAPREFPITGFSAAILLLPERLERTLPELAGLLAEAKRTAKGDGGLTTVELEA